MENLSDKTLLYAEDDLVTQLLHKDFFENYFDKVYSATDGRHAFEIYQTLKPDVVILDINMPFMDGLEICKKIREQDMNTRIVLLTARSDKETLLKAVELGLTTYLEKPVNAQKLTLALRKIADSFGNKTIKLWTKEGKTYVWDCNRRELFFADEHIALTRNEKKLLELLIHSKQDKVNYQKIFDYLWFDNNDKNYSEAAIKTLIRSLRKKLPENAIKNVYGLGYFLNKD